MRNQTLPPISIEPARFFSLQANLCRMAMLALLWLLVGTNLRAESSIDLPAELGAVVYQTSGDAATQLFIIANSHRSTITGANGVDTLQAQVETFQIGEWLVRRQQVAVLLPEGFFGSRPATRPAVVDNAYLDGAILTRRLSDTSSFVNAELLLHEQYGINLQQVEDRELYQKVRDALRAGRLDDGQSRATLDGRLESLQKRRSAAILQSATVLSHSNSLGSDVPRNAILTIGLAHLGDILAFIDSGEIQAPALPMTDAGLPSASVSLDPYQRPVGITVIVPHCLLESLPPELVNHT